MVIDSDGTYDPAEFNDRLLLGLKRTMSEAELHLLAGRLQGAKRTAAERGELRTPLPIGYLYDEDGQPVIDPDEEVATAIADVFTAPGPAYQVVAAFGDRRFLRAVNPDGSVRTVTTELPRAGWAALIPDHHQAYLS